MDLRVEPGAKSRNGTAGLSLAIAFGLACLGSDASHAAGDPVKGKDVFLRQCAVCHTADEGGENRFGPNLFGIVGRKAGTAPGFAYSAAFKSKATWDWSEAMIGDWITFPSALVPGTAMGLFQGVASRDKANVIAYLATLK